MGRTLTVNWLVGKGSGPTLPYIFHLGVRARSTLVRVNTQTLSVFQKRLQGIRRRCSFESANRMDEPTTSSLHKPSEVVVGNNLSRMQSWGAGSVNSDNTGGLRY